MVGKKVTIASFGQENQSTEVSEGSAQVRDTVDGRAFLLMAIFFILASSMSPYQALAWDNNGPTSDHKWNSNS